MKTFSVLLALCVGNSPASGELWCFLWFRLNKQLSKQSWRRWFETPPRSLWCHCNVSSCLPELTSILVVERYNPVVFLVCNPQIFIKSFRVETSCQRTEWQTHNITARTNLCWLYSPINEIVLYIIPGCILIRVPWVHLMLYFYIEYMPLDQHMLKWGTPYVNSLWHRNTIWRQTSFSTLAQVMACPPLGAKPLPDPDEHI